MSAKELFILSITSSLFGLIIGAYFGTVQYRIISSKHLVTSYCQCPSCEKKLALWHQIPVISWFLLKGKCYYCNKLIPIKYPLIEAGFLFFYLFSFILFYKIPVFLVCLWLLFIIIMLLLCCKKNFYNATKAFLIFLLYHFVYGGLLIILI